MMAPTHGTDNRGSIWKSPWVSVLLLLADVLGLSASWLGAYHLRRKLDPVLSPINEIDPYLYVFPVIIFVGILNCFAFGLYLHKRRLSSLNRPIILMRAGYHWLLYIIVVGFFFKELDLGRSVIGLSAGFGIMYLFASRAILKELKTRALLRGKGTIRSAIIGTSSLALEVKDSLRTHPEIGFSLVGLVKLRNEDLDQYAQQNLLEHEVPILGTVDELNDILEREDIEELFMAVAHLEPREQLDLMNQAERRGVIVHVVSNIFGVITESAKVDEISAFPVVTLRDGHLSLPQAAAKRTLDLFCGLVGIIVWMLFFHWWIALRIKKDSAGPVFFRQKRVGRDGVVFEMLKYRTMRTDTDVYALAPTEEEDPRITRFGRRLRRSSLDELPQLLNVLRGDMSMVGPRPEMPFIVENYDAWQRRRLDVKPGVTGLWQVIGRKNLPLHLNMQYDFYYIKNQSFLLDIEILFRTIPAVLKGKGAF